MINVNYIIINGRLEKKHFVGGRLKQPLAQNASMLAVVISTRQHRCPLCYGRATTGIKGHFYWLKVASGSCACQQKPVLTANTNHLWPSGKSHLPSGSSSNWKACSVLYCTYPWTCCACTGASAKDFFEVTNNVSHLFYLNAYMH
jgi:hypothetical protein